MKRLGLKWGAVIVSGAVGLSVILSGCTGNGAVAAQGQAFRVEPGDIALAVSTTGNVAFEDQSQLSFMGKGIVNRVLVSKGDHITAGQPIAELESESLVQELLRAELDLVEARALLDQINRSRPIVLAAAEAELVAAKQALFEADEALSLGFLEVIRRQQQTVAETAFAVVEAKTALDKADAPFTMLEVSQQEQAVAKAALQVQRAADALVFANSPFTIQDLRRQELSVAEARAAVENAHRAIALARQPVSEAKISSAEAAVANANDLLAGARASLDAIQRVQSRLVRQAEESLETGKQAYRSAMARFRGIGVAEKDIFLAPTDLEKVYGSFPGDPEVDALGTWKTLIAARDELDIALAKETLELNTARREIIAAERDLREANERLGETITSSDPFDVAVKEAALEAAIGDLIEENRLLSEIFEGGDPLEIAEAAAAARVAQAKLSEEQSRLAALKTSPSQADIDLRAAELALAELTLQIETRALVTLREGGEARQAEVLEANIASAVARLQLAEVALDRLQGGVDPLLLAQRKNDVREAQSAIAVVNRQLGEVILRAPDPGIVLEMNARVGDAVLPSTVIAVTADPKNLVVVALIDEIDVLRVRAGQPAQISLEPASEWSIPGSVRELGLMSDRDGGVVRYGVTIGIDMGSEAANNVTSILREGLSSRVEILLETQTGVLTIPIEAVQLTTNGRTVQVILEDRSTEFRPVELGITDGIKVVVTSGIAEGETILVPDAAKLVGAEPSISE